MYDKIAELVYNYTINNRVADINFVNQIIEIIIGERDLTDSIKDIQVLDNDSCGSSFSNNNSILTINIRNNMLKYQIPFLNNKVLLVNLDVVETIFHELDHALLRKCKDNGDKTIDVDFFNMVFTLEIPENINITDEEFNNLSKEEQDKIYSSILSNTLAIGKKLIYYNLFHDDAPHERRANINSHIDLNQVLNVLYDTSLNRLDKVRIHLLRKFINNCRHGYVKKGTITNSPSYDYIKKLDFEDRLPSIGIYSLNPMEAYINACNSYSLKERVLYGLPLSTSELEEINMQSNPFNVYQKVK